MFAPVANRARHADLHLRGYLSMCFGDPWEGDVASDQVVTALRQLAALGCDEVSLGDTIGVATPGHVRALLRAGAADAIDLDAVAMHFHDAYGQALANTYAALHAGITIADAATGGLGGCPYARTATGNLATEDLAWPLDGLDITHGVELHALAATSTWMADHLGRPSHPGSSKPSALTISRTVAGRFALVCRTDGKSFRSLHPGEFQHP